MGPRIAILGMFQLVFLYTNNLASRLEEGGITAQLLKIELEESADYLVPFLKWAELGRRHPDREALDAFLAVYDPDLPMHEQLRRLQAGV